MSHETIERASGVGVGFFTLARLICQHEPGVSEIAERSGRTLIWVPPTDAGFEEHIEVRNAKLQDGDEDLAIWQAEFCIGGIDAEEMLVYEALAHQLDGDPFAEHFYERFAGIYDRHDHDSCLQYVKVQQQIIEGAATPLSTRKLLDGSILIP